MAELIQGQPTPASGPAKVPQVEPVDEVSRWIIFFHAVAFVLGFSLVFILLGTAFGLLGHGLDQYRGFIQQLGAVLLVFFAATTLGVFRWLADALSGRFDVSSNPALEALVSVLNLPNQLLYSERRVAGMNQVNRRWGYLSSGLMGIAFAAGWTPCIGPILSSILFLAYDSQTVWQGAVLLAVYSLGLGIPFLLTGAMFSTMSLWLRKLNRYAGVISIISGIFMLYVAYLLWTGSLATLTTQFTFLNEWVFAAEDWVSGVTGTGGDLLGASDLTAVLLAFSAGLISFLSPCVLPLVPAYIGILSGAAVGSASRG